MIEEAQKRADIILEMPQQQALEIIARAPEGNPTGQDEFIHLISDDADEDDDKPTGDETIRFISDEDEDNDT
jgi:hypothetical protein